ncbi:MAG: carbamoyltransferase [Flavobacteriales bacterium]|nr:carbamoyltransferase [Flavobacteriales bacterium]
MYTLGINAYHGDSSACIYKDTELIAATEEERILRIKHWAGLPVEAIRFCLNEAGIGLEALDHITVSRDPKAKMGEKIAFTLRKGVNLKAVLNRGANALKIKDIDKAIAEALQFDPKDLKTKLHFVEHHRAHMASAFMVAPFEESAILSIDGMGDFSSTMRGTGKGRRIEVIDSISYPHSLGMFYTAFTQFLGFPNYGDEYKVMGLAPYGNPLYIEDVRKLIRLKSNGLFELDGNYFRHFKEGVSMNWEGGSPVVGALYGDSFEKLFGQARSKGDELTQHHKDLACSVQRVAEEVIFHLAEDLYRRTGAENLCITGGVAQNSVANGKVLEHTSFKRLFVPPAGHDAGTAVGSALYFLHSELDLPRAPFRHQAYTGAQFSPEEIRTFLEYKGASYHYCKTEAELIETVADKLADGKVIGWFQGRAEFGPRALGNRSILVDPTRQDARDLLNSKIKRRESFRPFAPSILEEYAKDYFENPDVVPFMEKVLRIRPEKRALIPAVTHVDGTGRLQTVRKEDNPRYYGLIKRFMELKGVPILLNTSFNENEPIVNDPGHAYDCYERTDMDLLVLGDFVVGD